MHAAFALRHRQDVFHAAEQVIRIQYRVFGNTLETVGAVRADVAIGSHQYSYIAKETTYSTNGLRPVVVQRIATADFAHDRRG